MVYRIPKFDLNKTPPADFPCNNEFKDTTLRLGSSSTHGCTSRLVLGLGRTPAKDPPACLSHQSTTSSLQTSRHAAADEGSTSSKRSGGGYMPSLLLAPRITTLPLQMLQISESEPSVVLDFSIDTSSDHQRSTKNGEFSGCSHPTGSSKTARGQLGLRFKQGSIKAHSSGSQSIYEGTFCAKSVLEGTNFCVARDGGKRHVVPGWTRSDCCLSHGGGKRLKFENQTTSAGGSTGYRVARLYMCGREDKYGNSVKESEGEEKNRCFGLGPDSLDNHSLSSSSVVSNSTSWLGNSPKRRQMIPPQVLVPSSMKSSSFLKITKQSSSGIDNISAQKSLGLVVPEGRVHGGSLLSLFRGNNIDEM